METAGGIEEQKDDAYLKEGAGDSVLVEQYIKTCDEVTKKMDALIPQVRDCMARVNSAASVGDLQTALADLKKLFKIDINGYIDWKEWGEGQEWSWTLGNLERSNFIGNITDKVREKCRVAFSKYQGIYGDLHFEAGYRVRETANDKYVELLKKEGYQVIFCDEREEHEDNTKRILLKKGNDFYFVTPDSWRINEAIESGEVVKIGDYNYPPLKVGRDNMDLITRAVIEDRTKRLNLTEEEFLEEARRLPSY